MLVSRAYDTPSTHVNKDRFALDFVQGGCKSYGTPVRAARRGRITFVNTKDTWGGGYGKNIILTHNDGKTSRYAHLSDYGKESTKDGEIKRGQIIGYQGNTGNVLGTACAAHPGTHLHFSYLDNGVPIKPEPMSLYPAFKAGNWYISDNVFPELSSGVGEKKPHWFSSLWEKFVRTLFTPDPPRVGAKNNTNISTQIVEPAAQHNFPLPTSTSSIDIKPVGAFNQSHYVYEVTDDNTSEIEVTIQMNNAGIVAWKEDSISLNIVGGKNASALFYHPSWMTTLRPGKIQEKVLPGNIVGMSFVLRVPPEEKSSVSFQLVHKVGITFSRIDTEYVQVDIIRKKIPVSDLVVENKKESLVNSSVVISTNTIALFVPEIYAGGSNASGPFIEVASVFLASEGESVPRELPNSTTTSTQVDVEIAVPSVPAPISVTSSTPEEISPEVLVVGPVTSTEAITTSTENNLHDPESTIAVSLYCSRQTSTSVRFFSPNAFLHTLLAGEQTSITLTAKNGPYILGIDTKIPKGKTLILEEGVVIYGVDKKASFIVEGTLLTYGTEMNPVLFTSLCEGETPQPGDWSHVYIAEGGVVSMTHTSIRYAGNPFVLSHGALASSEVVSRVLFNHGGTLSLDHVTVQDSYVKTNDEQYGAYIWIENAVAQEAVFVSEHSVYSGGYRAIHIEGTNSDQYIEGKITHNKFTGFSAPYGPLTIHRDVPFINENTYHDNSRNGAYFESAVFVGSHVLEKGKEYWFSSVTIEKESAVKILPGVTVWLLPGTDIFVSGTLTAEGAENDPVKILPESTKWGSIIITGGLAIFEYVDMAGGGLSTSVPSGMSRMIYAADADISIEGSHLHDSRIPGALIDTKNSRISVLDSVLSWETLPPFTSWKTYGIFADGGEVRVVDLLFHNVVVPIYATPATVVHEEEVVSAL